MAQSCTFIDSDAHVIEPRDMFERSLVIIEAGIFCLRYGFTTEGVRT